MFRKMNRSLVARSSSLINEYFDQSCDFSRICERLTSFRKTSKQRLLNKIKYYPCFEFLSLKNFIVRSFSIEFTYF